MTKLSDLDLKHHPDVECTLKRVTHWFNEEAKQGKGLVLAGYPGCGKTHICESVYTASRGMKPRPVMWAEPYLFEAIKNTYGGSDSAGVILDAANQAGLLILDDIGVEPVSKPAWAHMIYWRLLDKRFRNKLPTLITTNDPEDVFAARLGSRAMDRLQEMCDPDAMVDMFSIPSYRARNWA